MGEQVTHSVSEAVESATAGIELSYFERAAFDIVLQASAPPKLKAELFAQMARFNALYMVARAGSGHLGSSFSSLDIVTWLYLNVLQPEDRYYSSKGHDSPGLYATQAALGIIPFEKIHGLRRLGGLPGHPDVQTPGAYTNTGSLGMGVSKAKGFLFADKFVGRSQGRVFVLTGDGELQEGQFWESLISASRRRDGRLTVIVDHNKIQSDTYVANVSGLGDLEAKFNAFGWDVVRCNGHDVTALEKAFTVPNLEGKPRAIIADTIKGRGVSFMEHTAMPQTQEYYRYHSGAPTPEDYCKASQELLADIRTRSSLLGIAAPVVGEVVVQPMSLPAASERMIPAYAAAILEEGRSNPRVVALDADLVLDTGLIPFKNELPGQFIECGIAEQDMVSQAGTMALSGLLPVVHSFACFLTSRAFEQIYNNCTERTKIIYVGSLAGVLPGGPGHSHQAVRDVTAMSGMPGMRIVEPVCSAQVKPALQWAARVYGGSTYLRLTSIPLEGRLELAEVNHLVEGRGHILRRGNDLTLVAAGAIMTIQALKTAKQLADHGLEAQVVSTPWLNCIDLTWFAGLLTGGQPVVTLENHGVENGFGCFLVSQLAMAGLLGQRKVLIEGIRGIPACGRNDEVLVQHGLDEGGLTKAIMQAVRG